MLRVNHLAGFGGGAAAPPAELTYITGANIDTDLTTYTFSSQSFGAVDTTRRIIVAFHWVVTNAARTIASATIGGVAATIHTSPNGQATTGPTSAQSDTGVGIISALVPTGTSGDVVVTMSGAVIRGAIEVFRLVNEVSATPTAGMTDIVISGGTLTGTINIPAGGCLVAAATFASVTSSTITWTGVTEDNDAQFENNGFRNGGGHQSAMTVESNRTVTAVVNGTPVRGALAALVWN